MKSKFKRVALAVTALAAAALPALVETATAMAGVDAQHNETSLEREA